MYSNDLNDPNGFDALPLSSLTPDFLSNLSFTPSQDQKQALLHFLSHHKPVPSNANTNTANSNANTNTANSNANTDKANSNTSTNKVQTVAQP